jgi:hypothetical protein
MSELLNNNRDEYEKIWRNMKKYERSMKEKWKCMKEKGKKKKENHENSSSGVWMLGSIS